MVVNYVPTIPTATPTTAAHSQSHTDVPMSTAGGENASPIPAANVFEWTLGPPPPSTVYSPSFTGADAGVPTTDAGASIPAADVFEWSSHYTPRSPTEIASPSPPMLSPPPPHGPRYSPISPPTPRPAMSGGLSVAANANTMDCSSYAAGTWLSIYTVVCLYLCLTVCLVMRRRYAVVDIHCRLSVVCLSSVCLSV